MRLVGLINIWIFLITSKFEDIPPLLLANLEPYQKFCHEKLLFFLYEMNYI
ncbi:hypothetical protein MtrunA17_Chr2g0320261 [Medicago truncatula]|uniref:Transmembrane protein n=1 Tax=Medicago truncatula TaxID=3880 RepID=A0A396JG65_MEDTR|nr:hypothetical protein MtrunA17_Chr2g0320261 [Medicago truncatula]